MAVEIRETRAKKSEISIVNRKGTEVRSNKKTAVAETGEADATAVQGNRKVCCTCSRLTREQDSSF